MERRVQIGNISETPRKVFTYNQTDPSSYVVAATPSRKDRSAQQLKSIWKNHSSELDDGHDLGEHSSSTEEGFSRPKTSRGTSHPSPDDFFDYVIPSPLSKHGIESSFISMDEGDNEIIPRGEINIDRGNNGVTKKVNKEKKEKKSKKEEKVEKRGKREKKIKKEKKVEVRGSEDEDDRHVEMVMRREQTIFMGCWLFGSLLRV